MKSKAPGYSMGTRFDKPIMRTPGPGDYIKEKPQFKGHYMGTAARPLNQAPEKTPGPGAYHSINTMANVPEYSLRKAPEHKYR